MKRIFSILACAMAVMACAAQSPFRELSSLPIIHLVPGQSIHLRSPEPISYVDISPGLLSGDLPLPNLLRVRTSPDSAGQYHPGLIGSITVVGEAFIAQYQVVLLDPAMLANADTELEIATEHMLPLSVSPLTLTQAQIRANALGLLEKRGARPIKKVSQKQIGITLNGIYSAADLIFLDIGFSNSSHIDYQVDQLRFSIVDKRIIKATNHQSIELEPVFALYPLHGFSSGFRNIYVLKKASFPAYKQLLIELSEVQVSGRTTRLSIGYGQLLRADTF